MANAIRRRPVVAPRGRPVDVVEVRVVAQRVVLAAVFQEELQLGPGRDLRRAQQARHRERAAGIGPGRAGLQRFSGQPAAQETRHEGIARAQHVVDLDRKSAADDAMIDVVRDRVGKHRAALGPALQHDGGAAARRGCCAGPSAHRPRRRRS